MAKIKQQYLLTVSQKSANFHPTVKQGDEIQVDTVLDTTLFKFDKLMAKTLKALTTAFVKANGHVEGEEFDTDGLYNYIDESVTSSRPISKEDKVMVAQSVQDSILEASTPENDTSVLAAWAFDTISTLSTSNARKLVAASLPHAERIVALLTEDAGDDAMTLADLVEAQFDYEEVAKPLPAI